MTKEEIIQSLEGSITTLEQAHRERVQAMRDFLFTCKVSNIYELEDLNLFRSGVELDNQIELLKDLIDDLKYQVLKIRGFNNR